MKIKQILLTTLMSITLTSNGLLAQNATNSDTPKKPNTPNWVTAKAEKLPENLKESFFKAYKQINSDPKVLELRKTMQSVKEEYTKTIEEAMQKIDPKLAEALKTISDSKNKDTKSSKTPYQGSMMD